MPDRVAVLVDQHDLVVVVERDDGDRAGVLDDLADGDVDPSLIRTSSVRTEIIRPWKIGVGRDDPDSAARSPGHRGLTAGAVGAAQRLGQWPSSGISTGSRSAAL